MSADSGEEALLTDRLLARSVLCRALRLGLGTPTPASREAFEGPREREALLQASRLLDAEGGGLLTAAVEALVLVPLDSLEVLRSAHSALFGHALQGRVCPYETEYGAGAVFQQAQELADIAGYYLAFGLRLPDEMSERPDHVACEIEFYHFLLLKEIRSVERMDEENLDVSRRARQRFLGDHLGRFGRAFGGSVAEYGAGGFHGRLGAVLSAFLENECRCLGVPSGPEFMEIRPAVDDALPMACGTDDGDELLQIGGRKDRAS